MAATNSWKKDLIRQNRNLVTKAASHRRRRRRCRSQPLPRFPLDFKTLSLSELFAISTEYAWHGMAWQFVVKELWCVIPWQFS